VGAREKRRHNEATANRGMQEDEIKGLLLGEGAASSPTRPSIERRFVIVPGTRPFFRTGKGLCGGIVLLYPRGPSASSDRKVDSSSARSREVGNWHEIPNGFRVWTFPRSSP
jgi:hypothetical protein